MSSRAHAERVALAALACSAPALAHAHDLALQRPLPSLPKYLALGLEHILTGFDHLAFLIGLVLITRRLRPLLCAVTAFTVGHSLSLSASSLSWVELPSRWVETAIALSIAYVAVLNLRERQADARFWLSGAFGFVHGFGFAGALREIGLPSAGVAPALLAFNAGVELAQLAVLGLVLPSFALLRRSPRAWTRTALTINVVLLGLGFGWALERAFFVPAVAADTRSAQPRRELPQRPAVPSALQLDAAAHVCELFARRPELRRAECTGQAARVTFEQPCTRVLASALAREAVAVVQDELETCEAELAAAHAQCDLTRAARALRTGACHDTLQPRLTAGSACASQLECSGDLDCRGVTPLRLGTCEGARSERTDSLGARSDPLGARSERTDSFGARIERTDPLGARSDPFDRLASYLRRATTPEGSRPRERITR